MTLIDEARKLLVVREIIDTAHFTGIWRGQPYECRALPDTGGLVVGDVAFCHVLPGNTELVALFQGRGRIIVVGRDSGNNIKIARTRNFTSASPTWTPLSVAGLPTSILWLRFFANWLGPTPVGMMVTTDALTANQVWVNTDLYNPASVWTLTFDVAIANALQPIGGQGFFVNALCASEVSAGLFALAVTYFRQPPDVDPQERYIFHTHDNGGTWTVSDLLAGYNDFFTFGLDDVVLGRNDADIMYSVARFGTALQHRHYMSTDGGHIFVDTLTHDSSVNGLLQIPKQGNIGDLICYWERDTT